jgi:hypothetical protein
MATRADERRGTSGAVIALVILLLVLALVGIWYFLLRGDGEEVAAPTVPSAPAPTPEPTETAARPGRRPVETFEVFAPKDPFRPAVALAGTGATPPPGTSGGTTDGTTDGTTGGNGSATGGNGGGGRNESIGGHRVRLVDVFRENGGERARVQVDGTVYTVREGDRFADNFELLSIEGRCASLLFGDDQFTLCEGEEILK